MSDTIFVEVNETIHHRAQWVVGQYRKLHYSNSLHHLLYYVSSNTIGDE